MSHSMRMADDDDEVYICSEHARIGMVMAAVHHHHLPDEAPSNMDWWKGADA